MARPLLNTGKTERSTAVNRKTQLALLVPVALLALLTSSVKGELPSFATLTIYHPNANGEPIAVLRNSDGSSNPYLIGGINEKLADGGFILSMRNDKVVYMGEKSFFPKIATNQRKPIPLSVAAVLLCKSMGLNLVMVIPKSADEELCTIGNDKPEKELEKFCKERKLKSKKSGKTVFIGEHDYETKGWQLTSSTARAFRSPPLIACKVKQVMRALTCQKYFLAANEDSEDLKVTILGEDLDKRLSAIAIAKLAGFEELQRPSVAKVRKVYKRALDAARAGDLKTAKKLLVKLINRAKPRARYYNLLFKVYWRAGARKSAYKALEGALKVDPMNEYARRMHKRVIELTKKRACKKVPV